MFTGGSRVRWSPEFLPTGAINSEGTVLSEETSFPPSVRVLWDGELLAQVCNPLTLEEVPAKG